MKPDDVLALYDAQVRANPPSHEGLESGWVDGLVRTTGLYNLIEYFDLQGLDPDAVIDREIAHFRSLGAELEWKVFGHDRPADLRDRLIAKGFEPQDEEIFLAYDLAEPLPPSSKSAPVGVEVRPVTSEAQLPDFVAAIIKAFGREIPEQTEAVRQNLGKGHMTIYVAYENGEPIGSGRLDTPKDRQIAGLYAGGVAEDRRGRGVYRALVEARMQAAAVQGYRYAIVEAGPMSLPILKRLGFVPLTTSQGFVLKA